ncbi:hypothetical protein GDO81_011046 [Engystomops pustulosus]|uniref:Uncharacterized protein n=1 Tax=Engystomops pustulosus TaxID=76066 RepID=A0AAV7C5S3_ENGPU|nr:hypothetical protein GDO81_011046 [Engystomops pustulosus]
MLRPLTLLRATEKKFSKEFSTQDRAGDTSYVSGREHPTVTITTAGDVQTRAICIEQIFFKLFCLFHLIGKTLRIPSEIYPTENPRPRRGCRIS